MIRLARSLSLESFTVGDRSKATDADNIILGPSGDDMGGAGSLDGIDGADIIFGFGGASESAKTATPLVPRRAAPRPWLRALVRRPKKI